MSQPSRAAWIEIATTYEPGDVVMSRSPLGLRGLKLTADFYPLPGQAVAAHLGCVD